METPEVTLRGVSQTSLLTLYCRAIESQSQDPILHDPKAVALTQMLSPLLAKSQSRLDRRLAAGRIDPKLVVHIAMRAKRYDTYAKAFLEKHPAATVVNLGCGMDTRFWRIDNGSFHLYDLDLPEVIAAKGRFLQEGDRYHFIASSVLEEAWMATLSQQAAGPFIFLAEGLFMYLHEPEVKALVLNLQSHFPGCELVCEVFNKIWLSDLWRWMITVKMQKQFALGKDVDFHFGIRTSDEMESWGPGITFLDDWSYLNEDEKKMGIIRLFRHSELLRKTQWTVHYRLDRV